MNNSTSTSNSNTYFYFFFIIFFLSIFYVIIRKRCQHLYSNPPTAPNFSKKVDADTAGDDV
jgi:hypothetical protein